MSNELILLRDWQASQVEFWRPLVAGLYDVSTLGRIRSLRKAENCKGKAGGLRSILRDAPLIRKLQRSKKDGYMRLATNKLPDGTKKVFIVHREVAKAFIPNPDGLPEVNHITGLKTDNRLENLEWSTRSHNIKHSFDIGLRNNFMLVRRKDHEHLQARVAELERQLAEERSENRRSERWWANALLRAKNSFPLPPKPVDQPPDTPELVPASQGLVPGMDDGEVEALIATGAEYGQKREDVIRFLKQERGSE